jgi:pimeloyl-ACP methyl ester carboxylesterase
MTGMGAEAGGGGITGMDIAYRGHDDVILHAKVYGGPDLRARPAICLPGLTRNGRDFEQLAVALATRADHARRVFCLDYRGRGRSEWDRDWRNYAPDVELRDVLDLMTLEGLSDAAIIGTSRGGILAMLLAVAQPAALGCVILNDIGPVIETSGLARIMGYAGKIPIPRDWDEARRLVRDMHKRQFPLLDELNLDILTRQLFNEEHGKPAISYDPNIGKALSEIDIAKPVPDMWAYFDALGSRPVMVLRGENSDILSEATLREMERRHPGLVAVTIQNEGHAPLLNDRFSQRLIADFLAQADTTWQQPSPEVPRPRHREIHAL